MEEPIQNGDGGQADIAVQDDITTPWYETLADESMRADPSLTRYETIDDFAKGHKELERKIGEKAGVQIPGEDATPEQWAEFHKQIPGYPESPDKYGIEGPQLPEGMPGIPEEVFGAFLAKAHEAGLTGAQIEPIVDWFEEYNASVWQDMENAKTEQAQEGMAALKQKYGALADRNLAIAEEGLRREFGVDGLDWLGTMLTRNDRGVPQLLSHSPQFVQMAYEWATSKGHDRFVPGGQPGPATQGEAQERIEQARRDLRAGNISQAEFNAIQNRYGPLAYNDSGGNFTVGTLTAMDVAEEQ